MSLMSALAGRLALPAAIALCGVAGCQKRVAPMPPTFPVTGKVVSKAGKVVAGTIAFQPATDTQMTCNAILAADGTFSLSTLRTSDGARADGAPVGEYRVTILPASSSHQTGRPQTLPQQVVVKPEKNSFIFEIDQENP
jgi:hypothetical protein